MFNIKLLPKFQFLLVQLIDLKKEVSTISFWMFQFLLVQLIAIPFDTAHYPTMFQFLLVQLIDLWLVHEDIVFPCFNSFWFN